MKIIYNKILPFGRFKAINLFGLCFVKKKYGISHVTINHEMIHSAQQKELLYVFFYIIYFLEWIFRLVVNYKTAYKSISFEKEAYTHQHEQEYLRNRRRFAMWRKVR